MLLRSIQGNYCLCRWTGAAHSCLAAHCCPLPAGTGVTHQPFRSSQEMWLNKCRGCGAQRWCTWCIRHGIHRIIARKGPELLLVTDCCSSVNQSPSVNDCYIFCVAYNTFAFRQWHHQSFMISLICSCWILNALLSTKVALVLRCFEAAVYRCVNQSVSTRIIQTAPLVECGCVYVWNRKMLPRLLMSYLSEDETGGRGAAIRPLESTPPGIGSSIHLKKGNVQWKHHNICSKPRMFSHVVLLKRFQPRGQSWNRCLSVDGPINQHPSSCEK